MAISPSGLARLEAKVRQLTAGNLLRRETHARSRAAFGVASVLRDLLGRNPTSLANWPRTSEVGPDMVLQLLRADVAMSPTLAILGAVGDALRHDFELLFLPGVLLAVTGEPAAIDQSWPGVVSVSADNAMGRMGVGPPPPLPVALSERARSVGAAFSAAAAKEFKGDLANYPVWRFLLPTDDAGGKLQLRFVARAAVSNSDAVDPLSLPHAVRWHDDHRTSRGIIY